MAETRAVRASNIIKKWQLLSGRQKARDIWLKVIKEISFRILQRVGPVFIAVPVDIMV